MSSLDCEDRSLSYSYISKARSKLKNATGVYNRVTNTAVLYAEVRLTTEWTKCFTNNLKQIQE